jgi:hypothetical protein
MSVSHMSSRGLSGTLFFAALFCWPVAPALSQDAVVADVQAELKEMGYYTGVVDGISGPLTEGAVAEFEEATGRPVTGRANAELLAAIDAAADSGDEVAAGSGALSADEMEVLVARIALYPDDLVAAIIAASLYPLQVVQAARFLEESKADKSLKPSDKWDGSVVSLLNYPEVVKMMNDDLDWTEQLGQAAVNQQQDMLMAIQQLRDKAVASDVLASNDKVVVEEQNDNVVIRSADPEIIYVPSYEPEALYEPEYVSAGPAVTYSEPYPSYYYPTAPYWPALVTGAVWGAMVDWDDWDTWGGDVDIDIDNIDDINLDWDNIDIDNIDIDRKDIDWRNVDRSKIKFDSANFDRDKLKRNLERSDRNRIADKGRDRARDRAGDRPANAAGRPRDVRRDVEQGLADRAGRAQRPRPEARDRTAQRKPAAAPERARKPAASKAKPKKPSQKKVAKKRTAKPKAGARHDTRARKPSAIGHPSRGKTAKVYSSRGHASRGGGHRGGRGGGGRRR